jgi:hypothetical protein
MNLVLSGDSAGFVDIDTNMFENEESKIVEAWKMGFIHVSGWINAQMNFQNWLLMRKGITFTKLRGINRGS